MIIRTIVGNDTKGKKVTAKSGGKQATSRWVESKGEAGNHAWAAGELVKRTQTPDEVHRIAKSLDHGGVTYSDIGGGQYTFVVHD